MSVSWGFSKRHTPNPTAPNLKPDTKTRILLSAKDLFARRGFARTTVADICEQADANLAAVNYHFQSKDNLYAAVWFDTLEQELIANPPDGSVPADAPALDRLAGRIRGLVHRFIRPDEPCILAMLIVHELSQPTPIGERVRRDAVRPVHQAMQDVIKEVLGEYASERDTFFVATSIVHQCLGLGLLQQSVYRSEASPKDESIEEPTPGGMLRRHVRTAEDLQALVDHITSFSLAGIAQVRQQIAARANGIAGEETAR